MKQAVKAKASLVKKTLLRSDGKRVHVVSIDANSPSFGTDLEAVFKRNVAKAKREHKKDAKRGPGLSRTA